jgi:hypothetical protein
MPTPSVPTRDVCIQLYVLKTLAIQTLTTKRIMDKALLNPFCPELVRSQMKSRIMETPSKPVP